MNKTQKFDELYMNFAIENAQLSHAVRAKVGAVLVTRHGTILQGYNGTPNGYDNACEDDQNVTKPDVIHAELNALLKAAKEGISVLGATMYVTLQPCRQCSAMLKAAGISRLVYLDNYRDSKGTEQLQKFIPVEQLIWS